MNDTDASLPPPCNPFQYLESLGTDVITVYVGPQRKKWTVHLDLICSLSPFFDKAIHGSFAESRSKEIDLPEDLPEVFEILVQRLYGGSLRTRLLIGVDLISGGRHCCELFTKYYRLVDKLLLPNIFKIEAIDEFLCCKLQYTRFVTSAPDMSELMQNIPGFDPAHKLMLDLAAYDYVYRQSSWLQQWLKEWFPTCSDEQKLEYVESLGMVAKYHTRRDPVGDNSAHMHSAMQVPYPFKSVADIPRYQVGFLAKHRAENKEQD